MRGTEVTTTGGALVAVAAGGAVGAVARHGLAGLWPHQAGGVPWSTLVVNGSGCLLIGVLMVLLTEIWPGHHRLLRPFLGPGVLGGYTTFSAYAVDAQRLVSGGSPATAALYLVGTLATALVAVYAGMAGARFAARAGAP